MRNLIRHIETMVHSPGKVLLFLLGFTVAYFIFAHEGFYWIDDYGYAKYAWQVTKGTFSVTPSIHESNPLTHRFMIFAPVAFFYYLFGISIYTTTLWPLFCTLGSIFLVYLLFRKQDKLVAVFGMVLLGLYFHTQFLATYLYPDNILMFFSFAGTAILFRLRNEESGKNSSLYALGFAAFNFLAFLSKETISYFLLFYVYIFLLDLSQKKHRKFWLWAISLGVVFLTVYFGWYQVRTGNFFYRFHIIAQTSLNYLEDIDLPFYYAHQLPERLTFEPLRFFISSGIMIPLALASGSWFFVKKPAFFKLSKSEYFWHLLGMLLLGQFWFAPTSLTEYIPVTLVPRMCSILMPALCISAAYSLKHVLEGNKILPVYFCCIFLLICFFDQTNTLVMYAGLALLFAFIIYLNRKPRADLPAGFVTLTLTGILLLRPLHFMLKPSVMAFPEQNTIVKNYLNNPAGNYLVYTDPWTLIIHDFFYDFEVNPAYTYRNFSDQKTDVSRFKKVYLLVNKKGLKNPDMAKLQTIQEDSIAKLFPDKKMIRSEGEVVLYQVFPK